MGYGLALRLREERFNKSIAAAEKWLKGAEPTMEKREEAKQMFAQYSDAIEDRMEIWSDEWKKPQRMYWWSMKVYNGMLLLTSSEWKKEFIWG